MRGLQIGLVDMPRLSSRAVTGRRADASRLLEASGPYLN